MTLNIALDISRWRLVTRPLLLELIVLTDWIVLEDLRCLYLRHVYQIVLRHCGNLHLGRDILRYATRRLANLNFECLMTPRGIFTFRNLLIDLVLQKLLLLSQCFMVLHHMWRLLVAKARHLCLHLIHFIDEHAVA